MDTFNFPNHKVVTKYPDSSGRIQFGKNWIFTSAPDAPDQRIFTLSFKGFKYYGSDGSPDLVTDASFNNMGALEAFYQSQRLNKSFLYPHPVYGTLTVRFNKPLEIPNGIENGDGMVEPFEIELIELPA